MTINTLYCQTVLGMFQAQTFRCYDSGKLCEQTEKKPRERAFLLCIFAKFIILSMFNIFREFLNNLLFPLVFRSVYWSRVIFISYIMAVDTVLRPVLWRCVGLRNLMFPMGRRAFGPFLYLSGRICISSHAILRSGSVYKNTRRI